MDPDLYQLFSASFQRRPYEQLTPGVGTASSKFVGVVEYIYLLI